MNPAALRVARLWAAYHIGDPTWADAIAEILTNPTAAEAELRAALGDDYGHDLRLANRHAPDGT